MNYEVVHAEVVGYILATYQILISHCIFQTSLLAIRSPLNSMTTLTMNFQIVLSSILHSRNNYIHNHAIQNPILHSQFLPFMSQSISTRYTLLGNPFENFLIGQILATKAIFLRISESRAKLRLLSFFYSMSYLLSPPIFMLFDMKCSTPPPPVHLRTVKAS